jgi:hypothetical protein
MTYEGARGIAGPFLGSLGASAMTRITERRCAGIWLVGHRHYVGGLWELGSVGQESHLVPNVTSLSMRGAAFLIFRADPNQVF